MIKTSNIVCVVTDQIYQQLMLKAIVDLQGAFHDGILNCK